MRAKYENCDKSDDVTQPGGRFYQDLEGYALDK